VGLLLWPEKSYYALEAGCQGTPEAMEDVEVALAAKLEESWVVAW